MKKIINFLIKQFKIIVFGMLFASTIWFWSVIIYYILNIGSKIFQVGFTFDQEMEFYIFYIFLFLVVYSFGAILTENDENS